MYMCKHVFKDAQKGRALNSLELELQAAVSCSLCSGAGNCTGASARVRQALNPTELFSSPWVCTIGSVFGFGVRRILASEAEYPLGSPVSASGELGSPSCDPTAAFEVSLL